MCGLCGYATTNSISINNLHEMNELMSHRGPDDQGCFVMEIKKWNIGLAHKRLSIIDLSDKGHQPMFSADKKVGIVYNGEIYNFLSIRTELQALGHVFKSKSDTEVILESYLEWGSEFILKLNGMFAIVILDKQNEKIYLFRDRMGQKPLYYHYSDNNFVFSSELKPIMKFPYFRKEINQDVIGRYLYHQYINTPHTIFKNTYKVKPGCGIIWDNGEIKEYKYWDLLEKFVEKKTNKYSNYSDVKTSLKKLIYSSVESRLISDVPLGTFLSGGIDSSLITAIANDISPKPIKTFTIGFDNSIYNEAQHAKMIANHLKTEHHELYISDKNMLNIVDSIPEYYDEPFADSSQIPTMLVSQMAKENVTVALSGDGGDELFCGYNSYDIVKKMKHIKPFLPALKSLLSENLKKNKFVKKIAPGRSLSIGDVSIDSTNIQYLFQDNIDRINKLIKSDSMSLFFEENGLDTKNVQEKLMLLNMLIYLPDDILTKVDRASMKYSLETRCPLLDYKIVEESFAVPHKYKYKNGIKKYILKDILYDMVPKEFLDRPKKGFSVPLENWVNIKLKSRIVKYSSQSFIKTQGIFDYESITSLVNEYYSGKSTNIKRIVNLLWSFLCFQMWYEEFIK